MQDTDQPPTSSSPLAPESYKEKNFLFTSFLGGMAALWMESILHPIDTIKTRAKANTKVYVTLMQQAKKMYIREGPLSYFSGFTCTLCGSTVANGAYFYIYERLKYELNKRSLVPKDVVPFIGGFVGGFMSDFIYLPFDVIRTRMQLKPGTYDYKNFFDGATKVVNNEGFRTLYLGAPVFFSLSALLLSLMFGFYEMFHRILKPVFPNKEGANIPLSITSSVLGSSVAAFLTNPLDVLVTRIQSRNTAVEGRYTILGIIKNIYKNEGLMGFMKGVTGNMSYYGSSAVILFPTYEVLRVLFGIDLSESE